MCKILHIGHERVNFVKTQISYMKNNIKLTLIKKKKIKNLPIKNVNFKTVYELRIL